VYERAEKAMQALDPKAECSLFLDDTYFKGVPEAVAIGKEEYQQALAAIGLQLNESKTQLWLPRADTDMNSIPVSIRQYVTHSLKAVGASVPYAKTDRLEEAVEDNTSPCPPRANARTNRTDAAMEGNTSPCPLRANSDAGFPRPCGSADDWRDTPLSITLEAADHNQFLKLQTKFFGRLKTLMNSGLSSARATELVKVWSSGACVHIQRALPTTSTWAEEVDAGVIDFLQELEGETMAPLQQRLVFLKTAEGGLNFGSAKARASAAWIGAWEGGLAHVAQQMGIQSFSEFCHLWPEWLAAIKIHEARLQTQEGQAADKSRWTAAFSKASPKAQAAHSTKIAAKEAQNIKRLLTPNDNERLLQQSGPGAAAFLSPGEGMPVLPNTHFEVALRRRLMFADPISNGSNTCCHQSGTHPCAAPINKDGGKHAVSCHVGGGVQARHDDVKGSVAEWVDDLGLKTKKEQLMPKWNTEDAQAVLDIVFIDRRGKQLSIDVSIVDGADGRAPAKHAITRREREKHRRYPGSDMIPFVLDCRGRWGKEALDFVTYMCKDLPEDERLLQVRKIRSLVSFALQKSVAEQIISAARPRSTAGSTRTT
jgi:hypothetical protein